LPHRRPVLLLVEVDDRKQHVERIDPGIELGVVREGGHDLGARRPAAWTVAAFLEELLREYLRIAWGKDALLGGELVVKSKQHPDSGHDDEDAQRLVPVADQQPNGRLPQIPWQGAKTPVLSARR